MRNIFKRKLWMKVTAIFLVLALNLGSLDGVIRYALQEWTPGSFSGFLRSAAARDVEVEKNKNSLPDTAGPKKPKNPLAEEAKEEINGKRTVNSKTFKIGENAYKTEVYQTPVHYVNENNALVDIDNTLVESKAQDYAYENRANNVKVRFSEKATGNKLGQIRQNLFSLDWSLLDGKEVAGNTSRNTITYSGIAENTDLRYTVDGSALKEEIILNSPAAPAEFKFVLDLKNLTYKAREDGSIDFVEPRTGTTVWVMPKPFMYDARGERSEAVTAGLAEENGKPVLTVKADGEWLSAPDRQFPVVIDPTLQPGGGPGRDTFISSKYHDKNYRAKNRLYCRFPSYLAVKFPKSVSVRSGHFPICMLIRKCVVPTVIDSRKSKKQPSLSERAEGF